MKLKTPEINAELTLFCPRRNCPCYQRSDNKLTKDGAYITKNHPIPRLMCQHFSGHIHSRFMLHFKFYRWQVSIVRMEALSIVEDLDVIEDGFFSRFTGRSVSWFTHSVFRVWKKLSETALFQFVHLRLMLCWMRCCLSSFKYLIL